MEITYLPTLTVLQELYEKPRDMNRFQWYLQQMLGENEDGETDVVLPITAANPMGREHCLAAVNALLEIDADTLAEEVFIEAARSFPDVQLTVRAAISLQDDLGGGWTNRYLREAADRMSSDPRVLRANRTRRFVLLNCWTSEQYTPADIRIEGRAALYRYTDSQRYGVPTTLRQLMAMDGAARAFGGATVQLDEEELAYTAAVIEPLLDSTDFAVQFACLFGDEAARNVGYEPQGLDPYAGFDLALRQALLAQ